MLKQLTFWFDQYESALAWIGTVSVLMFIFSLLMLPWLLSKIPVDYFKCHKPVTTWKMLLLPRNLLRNLLGLPVLIAGIIMLVLPGQGLLTVFLGLAIMQFPGKYALERWVISRRGVLTTINWIRGKAGVANLEF
ncbi:MAG: PGPGW domain-containing protein [Thiolinea sp.]